MKLAFITATFPSLTETFVFREWEALRQDKELEVHVFAIRKPKGFWLMTVSQEPALEVEYLRPDHLAGIIATALFFPFRHPVRNGRITRLFLAEIYRQPLQRYLALYFQMLMGIFLGRHLKANGFDSIHGHFAAASNMSFFAHLASGIPFTFTLYASDDLFMGPLPYFEEKLTSCRLVTTDTLYNKRQINLLTQNRFEEKIRIVYSGVDLKEFAQGIASTDVVEPLKLLSVGSMTGVKGYATVLEALRKVKQRGISFEYHIIGGGDEAETGLVKRLIKEYGLSGSVKLSGAQPFDFVRQEIGWCHVLVMASEIQACGRRDGLPTVIIEAMAAKRLVISTYISDIPNNVMNHKTGLIVAEKAPDQLADAIEYAVQHPEECRAMVENAYQMAVKKFDEKVNYTYLAELLKSEAAMVGEGVSK